MLLLIWQLPVTALFWGIGAFGGGAAHGYNDSSSFMKNSVNVATCEESNAGSSGSYWWVVPRRVDSGGRVRHGHRHVVFVRTVIVLFSACSAGYFRHANGHVNRPRSRGTFLTDSPVAGILFSCIDVCVWMRNLDFGSVHAMVIFCGWRCFFIVQEIFFADVLLTNARIVRSRIFTVLFWMIF